MRGHCLVKVDLKNAHNTLFSLFTQFVPPKPYENCLNSLNCVDDLFFFISNKEV